MITMKILSALLVLGVLVGGALSYSTQQSPECKTTAECSSAINALRRETRLEFDQRAIALEQARGNIEKRLEGMNEFRAQLKDQAGSFATKEDILNLSLRLDNIEKWQARIIGGVVVLQFLFGIGFAMYLRKLPPRQSQATSRSTDV